MIRSVHSYDIMSMSSEGSISTVAADINAGGSWFSVENTLSDTSQTFEFAESEQGYHSDGSMSDSETDFSAKVSFTVAHASITVVPLFTFGEFKRLRSVRQRVFD